ncbi:hypothetical protein [Streptomyces longwoodensis]|uniref:hypothetical protein n=1 Tax=Streptomyces longwoodensis TaxID=68231 RepID=UPI0038008C8F
MSRTGPSQVRRSSNVVTAVLAVTVGVQIRSRQPDTAVEVPGALDRFWRVLLPQLIH